MKHPWWHKLFTKTYRSPQMVPPDWVQGRIVFETNITQYCWFCKKSLTVNALDKYREARGENNGN